MSIKTAFNKFCLVSWKNHKTQWANPLEFVFILFSPMLLCLIAVFLRLFISVDNRIDTNYDPINLERSWSELIDTLQERHKFSKEFNRSYSPFIPQLIIGWAPNNFNLFEEIMNQATYYLDPMIARNFETCDDLKIAVQVESLFAGICFDSGSFDVYYKFVNGILASDENIPTILNYSIIFPSELRIFNASFIGANWMTLYQDDPKSSILLRLSQPYCGGYVGYVREGFINVQKAVSETFLKIVSGNHVPDIVLRRFPVIGLKQDPLLFYINRGLALLIIIGFLFPAQILVWQIVREKQSQMRCFLINMNFGNAIHFISWFFKGLVYMIFSSLTIIIVCKIQWNDAHGILTQTPWYVLLVVLCSYNVAATSFSLMVASFFRDSLTAIQVLTILWIITYMPFFILWNNPERAFLVLRVIFCAFPNTTLALVFESLTDREVIFLKEWMDYGYKLNFAADRVNVHMSCYISLICSVMHCCIGLYMDMWNSSELGKRRSLARGRNQNTNGFFTFYEGDNSFGPHDQQAVGINSTKIYEVEPSHRHFRIKIKKLCKRYAISDRPALNLLTWNIYENEVTILMGHNGCGKTTLLRILAGLQEPTRGSALISGHNIQTERVLASMELGLALENNLLLHDLSVSDHIRFICIVKGMMEKVDIKKQIDFLTKTLLIEHLKSRRVRNLTAKELCLLNICCAFAGHSSIILMDDLHSELDGPTQALIWNLINAEKSRRTIILVSNSTSLTELMADRLAIIAKGELKCTGTKPFLRNMYGHGYRLTCVKGRNCDVEQMLKHISTYMPNVTVESDIGYKIIFVLENRYEDQFTSLLDDLEENMRLLDILSLRIRDTSMEEIFLRFGCEDSNQSTSQMQVLNPQNALLINELYSLTDVAERNDMLVGYSLFMSRLRALLYKQLVASKGHLSIKILSSIGLLMGIICSFATVLLYGKNYELSPLSFNLTQLRNIDAFVEAMSDNRDVNEMVAFYTELLNWYDANVRSIQTDGVHDFYLLQENEFVKDANFRYIFGASFGDNIITAWFNNVPLHSAPFSLNLVHNAVARSFFDEEATIEVTLLPLPFQTQVNSYPQSPLGLGSLLGINFSLIFSYIWSGVTIFIINERCSSLKKQQLLAGVRFLTYWLAMALFDIMIIILISLILTLVVSLCLSPVHDFMMYFHLFLAFFVSGVSVVIISYVVAEFVENPTYGYIFTCFINVLGAIFFSTLITEVSQNVPIQLQFFSQYTFAKLILKFFTVYEYKLVCKDPEVYFLSAKILKCEAVPNCCIDYTYTSDEFGVNIEFCLILANIIVGITILIIIECHIPRCFWRLYHHIPIKSILCEKHDYESRRGAQLTVDKSVIAERHRIESMRNSERYHYAAILQKVGKHFRTTSVINRVDLCIDRYECVGISGLNNSGKTTLVKLLVNETRASYGSIVIRGYSMDRQLMKCYSYLGYCPQSDNLPNDLTPNDILYIHTVLHGYSRLSVSKICNYLLILLGLQNCSNRPLQLCTPGQRRRLAFALAILGSPSLVCVDGLPAGIDPIGKRTIFSITDFMQRHGTSFLYTTLSRIDSECLCQRAPLLHSGQLWTIGSHGQQTTYYRIGYLLEVRFKRKVNINVSLSRSTWNRINHFPMSPHKKFQAFMEIKFPLALLQGEHLDSMSFYIPIKTTTFSHLFFIIRKDAFEMNLEDFHLTRNVITGTHADLLEWFSAPQKQKYDYTTTT
ncbi:LOW QUALITY PROTEIN: phospholipid-transporting ATPase ABCA3 [Drosophila tropicalis]|uniref:LOW QUALITY PROTEIN: phospholipid-transporting ATPase ABCA3 n=1 Tax=Drosophila tropicalis TaxID=46794 RepID=UPI0035AC00FF